MIKKIRNWWYKRRGDFGIVQVYTAPEESYTRKQLENAYKLGYNDGKHDGLAIARDQATKSLKEILQWQNKKSQ